MIIYFWVFILLHFFASLKMRRIMNEKYQKQSNFLWFLLKYLHSSFSISFIFKPKFEKLRQNLISIDFSFKWFVLETLFKLLKFHLHIFWKLIIHAHLNKQSNANQLNFFSIPVTQNFHDIWKYFVFIVQYLKLRVNVFKKYSTI